MSSARQGLTVVGKVVGFYFGGPAGAMVGPAIGGEIGGADLPGDCASDGSQGPVVRGEGASANVLTDPA